MSTELHRWIQDDQEWACAAYDHGPFCRLCQRVDGTLRHLLENVDAGFMEVVGARSDGDVEFRLTPAGEERARSLIKGMGGDPDDADSTFAAIRRDIAGSN